MKAIKFSKFFTYVTFREKILMFVGTLGAIFAGALMPAISIVIGNISDTFDPDNSKE